jgi:hypothetical protein
MRKFIEIVFGREKKKMPTTIMENWFRTEYGKNWLYAYNHYIKTGSIHFNG